jgi:hypothetical protein
MERVEIELADRLRGRSFGAGSNWQYGPPFREVVLLDLQSLDSRLAATLRSVGDLFACHFVCFFNDDLLGAAIVNGDWLVRFGSSLLEADGNTLAISMSCSGEPICVLDIDEDRVGGRYSIYVREDSSG